MLKVLLWRIFFEWENLKAWWFPQKKLVYYFAFGANLDESVLKERKTFPKSVSFYALKDHELAFTRGAPFDGVAYASADPAPGKQIYGKLYQITQSELNRMNYYEVVPFLKLHRKCCVVDEGREINFYQTSERFLGRYPLEEYLQKILKGYTNCPEVPQAYIEALKKTPTIKEIKLIPSSILTNGGILNQLLPKAWVEKYEYYAFLLFTKVLQKNSLFERFL